MPVRITALVYVCPMCKTRFHPWLETQKCCSRKCQSRSPEGLAQRSRQGKTGGPRGGAVMRRIWAERMKHRHPEYLKGYRAGQRHAYDAGKRAGWAEACGEKEIPRRWLGLVRKRSDAA